MTGKTQLQRVESQLEQYGQISRNACLRNYISRLSAIIYTLQKQGWVFETKEVGGDYIYKVVVSPKERVLLDLNELKQNYV